MKLDGQCEFSGCDARVDWSKHDKPPPGWAYAFIHRYSKKGKMVSGTWLLCPKHTIIPAVRQMKLVG